MSRRTAVLILGLLMAGTLIDSLILYPRLPAQIPVHWDLEGHVDSWGDKRWAAFAGVGAIGIFEAMLFVLPWLSPRGFQVQAFAETFHYLMAICGALMAYLHVLALLAGLHPEMDLSKVLPGGLLLFLALMGNLLGKVRRNFWVGVRTPWTLANETVWIRTHRMAARLLFVTGLLGAAAVWLGVRPAWCFAGLLLTLLVPAVYSLILYKRLEHSAES